MLLEAIRTFNFKPKRGIAQLIEHGFIRGGEPEAIARFLFYADGLSKRSIGEYLGEGDAHNIATMHAFVDLMQFDHMPLTTALRRFLQAFRLPGEAQKIDRFMLKFAERYTDGNQTAFANADTAYKLAYSVIMLNTDAHNPQVKHRMTLQDFLKNNAGLDDDRPVVVVFILRHGLVRIENFVSPHDAWLAHLHVAVNRMVSPHCCAEASGGSAIPHPKRP